MKKLLCLSFLFMAFSGLVQAQSTADTTLKQFVGTYTFPEGSVVSEVTVAFDEKEGLTIASSAGVSELKRIAADTFSVVIYEGTAVFKRDANKKVNGVTIDARGYLLEGTRSDPAAFLYRNRKFTAITK